MDYIELTCSRRNQIRMKTLSLKDMILGVTNIHVIKQNEIN